MFQFLLLNYEHYIMNTKKTNTDTDLIIDTLLQVKGAEELQFPAKTQRITFCFINNRIIQAHFLHLYCFTDQIYNFHHKIINNS